MNEALFKPKTNKAKEKRVEQVKKLEIDEGSEMYRVCVSTFMQNGEGGIRKVKEKIGRYGEFERAWAVVDELDKRLVCRAVVLETAINHCEMPVEMIISRNIEARKRIGQRRQELVDALGKYGLELRNDSKMCEAYIEGRETDLDRVVEIMREMDYLYAKTNYQKILSKLIGEWKQDIREGYGWLDYDEYEELFDEELPGLSEQAKKRCMAGKAKYSVPQFMWKYIK